MILDGTEKIMKLGKKRKEIKIVKEIDTNYTFVDTTPLNLKHELEADSTETSSNIEKDLHKTRSIDLKKSKIRHKSRMVGGQNRQSHSSVYE